MSTIFVRSAAVLVLGLAAYGVSAEAGAPSPVARTIETAPASDPSFLESPAGWMVLRKYFPDLEFTETGDSITAESQGHHSWAYEVGTRLSLFHIDPVELDVTARLQFQSAVSPHGQWAFLASGFLSDLKPTLSLNTVLGSPYVYFRHSCKHDLDQARRLVIHQGFGLGYESPMWERPESEIFLPRGGMSVEGEINLPAVLPDQPTERYRWGVRAEVNADVLRIAPGVVLFGRLRGVLLGNQLDSDTAPAGVVQTGSWTDVDYQVGLGLKIRSPTGYYAIFFEHERLSDHWLTHDSRPAYLSSLGVAFVGGDR